MEKNKFRIGDIVTCTRKGAYVITDKDIKCKVVKICTGKCCDLVVEVIEDHNIYKGNRFNVSSKDFKKVTAAPFVSKVNGIYCKCIPIEDNKENIKQWVSETLENLFSRYDYETIIKGKKTIVILSDDKWNTVKVGIARCADTDKYDADIGTAIAAARAMDMKIPSFLYE